MLAIQKLTMIYYVFRLADPDTINNMFSAIDDFTKVDYSGGKVPEGGYNPSTLELERKGMMHAYINIAISAFYFLFLILFLTMTFKMASFENITKTSTILRCLSFFLVISLTVL